MIESIINDFSNVTPLGHVAIAILIMLFTWFLMHDISKSKRDR